MARRPPSTRADPACGLISPASTLRRVVLPAPLGPKIASVCPGARLNETPSSATTRPNAWCNPSAKSINAGGQVVTRGEEALVGASERRFILDEQDLTSRRAGPHRWGPI